MHVQQRGLIDRFRMNENTLATFLRRIEEGYNNGNPYHNQYGRLCSPAT